MASYNTTRYVEDLLERTQSLPPSFTIHLHLEYWTLNNGSKFLYNNQIASLLDDVRAHRIPVDFLDLFEAAKVPFYEGCMVVELLDYRPQRSKEPSPGKPERSRAVLHPNSETLWADICALNQRSGGKWADIDALDVEAHILLATSPPLCLDPDPHLTRIANHVLRVSTPTIPVSLKRKAAAMDTEVGESEKARRAKIMQFMNPRQNGTRAPSYRILDVLQNFRQARAAALQNAQQPPVTTNTNPLNHYGTPPTSLPSPSKPPTPAISILQADSPVDSDDKKKLKPRKTPTPQIPFAVPAAGFARAASGSQTPVPAPQPQPPQQPQRQTHHFINHTVPLAPSTSHSPLQPQVYPSVQAATEAAAAQRASTPAQKPSQQQQPQQQQHHQQRYTQSPRPPSSHTPAPPASIPHTPIPTAFQQAQAQVPNTHFLAPAPHPAPPATAATASKARAPGNATAAAVVSAGAQRITPTPQQQQQAIHAQILYAQQLQQTHQRMVASAQQKNGTVGGGGGGGVRTATPQVQVAGGGAGAVAASPSNKTAGAGGGVPVATQVAVQQQGTATSQQTQPQSQQQQQQHSAALAQQYGAAHLRAMLPGNAQLQAHLAAAAAGGMGMGLVGVPAGDGQAQQGQGQGQTQAGQTPAVPGVPTIAATTTALGFYPTHLYNYQYQMHLQRYWQQQAQAQQGAGRGVGMHGMGVGIVGPSGVGGVRMAQQQQPVAGTGTGAGGQGR